MGEGALRKWRQTYVPWLKCLFRSATRGFKKVYHLVLTFGYLLLIHRDYVNSILCFEECHAYVFTEHNLYLYTFFNATLFSWEFETEFRIWEMNKATLSSKTQVLQLHKKQFHSVKIAVARPFQPKLLYDSMKISMEDHL